MTTVGFRYHPQILDRFPNICGGVIIARGLHNRPSPSGLIEAYIAEQHHIIATVGEKPLSEIPAIAAWRAAFRQFGVDPTKYRSASEALLRRLTKKGDIPVISTLVDLCNLISIRNALPVAAFDTRQISGPITVQFAVGSETFTAHDTAEPEHPEPGEVIFCDPAGLVVARRWCWKQSAESTVNLDTRDVVITIETQQAGGESDIQLALDELLGLLTAYIPAEMMVTGVLNRDQSEMIA